MYILNNEEKKLFKLIASFYGAKLEFVKINAGGFWEGETISLAPQGTTFAKIASVFFHELGHYKNWIDGRYPIYHNPKLFGKRMRFFKTYKQMIRYCLNAEICTEKLGEQFLKEWMPGVKYRGYYKNNPVCYEFLYGYYLADS